MTDHDVLTPWATRLADALGLPPDFELDLDEVLDLARDAAHGVARPAAPVTTFLVGYAAGLRGGGAAEVTASARLASELATAGTDDVTGTDDAAGTEAR